jgi:hypothetical protein
MMMMMMMDDDDDYDDDDVNENDEYDDKAIAINSSGPCQTQPLGFVIRLLNNEIRHL